MSSPDSLFYRKGKLFHGNCVRLVNLQFTSKQLLDEIEHDIMNYQKRGLCYLRQITQTRGFDNS